MSGNNCRDGSHQLPLEHAIAISFHHLEILHDINYFNDNDLKMTEEQYFCIVSGDVVLLK